MDPKGDPTCCTLWPRNPSLGYPEQPFWSPVAIYNHLASTGYLKAVKMSLKVSKIHSKSDKFKPSQQSQPIPATSTNPIELYRISKKTHQTMRANTVRYKTLPLSRPSTMLVELGIDLQLRNWRPCTTKESIGCEIRQKNIQT